MHSTDTLIIGGGQAGLALSRCLDDRGHDHVVLERGRIAERWHSERWDSLRLLTPNWMTRLPGHAYAGGDPDGFMTAPGVARLLTQYATSFRAPVLEHTVVDRVRADDRGFVVDTDGGTFRSRNVVVATGWCDRPAVPPAARLFAPRLHQITPDAYRSPAGLPDGGVLVVGASATGVQLAHELHQSGRPVTLAVGSHRRLPRRYRGMDSCWWLDQMGAFDRTIDEVADLAAARAEPSLQLVGRVDHASLDLSTLQAAGVRLVGRVTGIEADTVELADDLEVTIGRADAQLARLLDRIDRHIAWARLGSEMLPREPIATADPRGAPASIDLRHERIGSVLWATGHRRDYHWLDLPVLDARGEIRQRRGVTPVAGAYVLGQRFQHHRNSSFIDGVGRDAQYVAEHICARTASPDARPSSTSREN